MRYDFRMVDVFSATPFQGNPVAVVMQADGLSDAEMQQIAAWTNLSETTFHLRPVSDQADYRLRIFTPRGELPFAGHPTLGSAHALLEAGLISPNSGHEMQGRVIQECAAGLVPVTLEDAEGGSRLSFELPSAKTRDLTPSETDRLSGFLGTALVPGQPATLVDVGARWVIAEVESAETLRALTPDLQASARFETDLGGCGITLFGRHSEGPEAIELRSFAPSAGVAEDPVCGSGNGAVAVYRLQQGQIAPTAEYIATQGHCTGRSGRIFLRMQEGRVHVGGQAVTTVEGRVSTG